MSNFGFIGRRFYEFKNGYVGYLTFIVNFSTFVTVLYGLNEYIQNTFKFTTFILIITVGVVFLATLIGHLHFKKQYPNEMDIAVIKNPYYFKVPNQSKEIPYYHALLLLLEDKLNKTETHEVEKLNEITTVMTQIKNLMNGKDMREMK